MTRTEILTIIQGGHLTDGDLADALLAEFVREAEELQEKFKASVSARSE